MKSVKVMYDDVAEDPRDWMDFLGRLCAPAKYGGDPKVMPPRDAIGKDVYITDHSGLWLAWNPLYVCPWDTTRCYYWVSLEDARAEFGVKRLSAAKRKRALEILRGEVETLAAWLAGSVYCVEIVEDGEVVESCGGLYGQDSVHDFLADYGLTWDGTIVG